MKSIRTKIMAGMGMTVALFTMILGLSSIILVYTSSDQLLTQGLGSTAGIVAERVEQEILAYENIAVSYGSRSDIADPAVPVSEKQEILTRAAENSGLMRANLIGTDGNSYFDGNSYADRDYFKKGMEGETYISTPVLSKVTGELTLIVAAPVWENGLPGTTVVGVVYFVPKESFLNDIMSTIKVSPNGEAYMIDKDGNTIADVTMDTVMTQNIEKEAEEDSSLEDLAAIHSSMRAGETGTGDYELNGKASISAYSPVGSTDGWSIAVTVPKSDFMSTTFLSIGIVAAIMVLAIVVSLLFARKLSGMIAGPVRLCTQRLVSLSEGDIRSDVPKVKAKDETGTLAESTESIVDTMKALIRDEQNVLGEMAAGNFTVYAREEIYKGDLKEILQSLKGINSRLRGTIQNIDLAAAQVASGVDQVSAGVQAFSQGATEQASSVEELAATINDINQNIQENAELAATSNAMSGDAGKLLAESEEKMQQLIAAMDEIGTRSDEISRIIKTIEDIAYQTNILALNAAVEAARAGNAGKGFAVVAEEVRSLAGKSQQEAQDTTVIIQEALSSVERGTKLVNETAECIRNTARQAGEAFKLAEKIAENSKVQADAVAQVSVGIDQISGVVQTNSATAQQSAAASEQISGQAAMLKREVDAFRLD